MPTGDDYLVTPGGTGQRVFAAPGGAAHTAAAYGKRYTGPMLQHEGDAIDLLELPSVLGLRARPVAINLFRSNGNAYSAAGSYNADLYCNVKYGAGGVTASFDVDATLGTQFSVVASTVTLSYRSYRPNLGAAYLAPAPTGFITLGATLGEGGVSPSRAPTYTTPYTSVADGTEQAFRVHPYARALLLLTSDDAINTDYLRLRFRREGGQVQQQLVLGDVGADLYTHGIPIPGASFDVALYNDSGAAAVLGLVYLLGI